MQAAARYCRYATDRTAVRLRRIGRGAWLAESCCFTDIDSGTSSSAADAHSDTYTHTYSQSNTYSDTNSDGNVDGNANRNTDNYTYADSD